MESVGSDDPTLGRFIVPDNDSVRSLSEAEDDVLSNVSQQRDEALVVDDSDKNGSASDDPDDASIKNGSACDDRDNESIKSLAEGDATVGSDDGGQSEVEDEFAVMRRAFQDPLERELKLYDGLPLIRSLPMPADCSCYNLICIFSQAATLCPYKWYTTKFNFNLERFLYNVVYLSRVRNSYSKSTLACDRFSLQLLATDQSAAPSSVVFHSLKLGITLTCLEFLLPQCEWPKTVLFLSAQTDLLLVSWLVLLRVQTSPHPWNAITILMVLLLAFAKSLSRPLVSSSVGILPCGGICSVLSRYQQLYSPRVCHLEHGPTMVSMSILYLRPPRQVRFSEYARLFRDNLAVKPASTWVSRSRLKLTAVPASAGPGPSLPTPPSTKIPSSLAFTDSGKEMDTFNYVSH